MGHRGITTLGFRGAEVSRHRNGRGDGVGRTQTDPLWGQFSANDAQIKVYAMPARGGSALQFRAGRRV
jgi:hypothetical protein